MNTSKTVHAATGRSGASSPEEEETALVLTPKSAEKSSRIIGVTEACSSHRCCAERRLIEAQTRFAERHGVPRHAQTAFLRRKFGSHVTVWRVLRDGTLGRSFPCVLCRKELERRAMVVHAVVDDEKRWFHGRLTDTGAPPSKPTCGQTRSLGFG